MTAHDQIRAMLDELMGTTRDGGFIVHGSLAFVLDLDLDLESRPDKLTNTKTNI